MTHSASTLDAAREVVLRTQNPGIAALQAQLHLGHATASALITQLLAENIILCPWPGREPGVHPDHRRVRVQSVKGDTRLQYIERVAQFALFYFELSEENSNAHSDAIKALLPAATLPWNAVQELFCNKWFGMQKLALTDGALAFHRWLGELGATPEQLEGVEDGIRGICLPYERPFAVVADPAVRLERAYTRLARFFRRSLREDFSEHSRAVEWFVPNAVVPQNAGVPGQHPEHVVPCAVLRDIAKTCYADHWSVQQVAVLLRSLLVVIWIDQIERHALDNGANNLRSAMPADWTYATGCRYARLHAKAISFQPAAGYACNCNAMFPQ
jgi:hypothetical protein